MEIYTCHWVSARVRVLAACNSMTSAENNLVSYTGRENKQPWSQKSLFLFQVIIKEYDGSDIVSGDNKALKSDVDFYVVPTGRDGFSKLYSSPLFFPTPSVTSTKR